MEGLLHRAHYFVFESLNGTLDNEEIRRIENGLEVLQMLDPTLKLFQILDNSVITLEKSF